MNLVVLFQRVAEAVRDSRIASVRARSGLVARTGYLLLAYLVLHPAARPSTAANPSGALRTVAATPLGRLPLAVAAVGFLAVCVSRLLGAFRDKGGAGECLGVG